MQGDGQKPALVDDSVLARLSDDVENDDGIWKVFVRDFIAQIPVRTERLRLTLTSGDVKGAMDAVASLRVSSQMVGALRLAGLACQLEQSLRHAATEQDPRIALPALAATHLRRIKLCAQRTSQELQAHIE
jgi:HPt (histidine-containing phosphotransfer) domain-containing protein